jgi:hypothetical protein
MIRVHVCVHGKAQGTATVRSFFIFESTEEGVCQGCDPSGRSVERAKIKLRTGISLPVQNSTALRCTVHVPGTGTGQQKTDAPTKVSNPTETPNTLRSCE